MKNLALLPLLLVAHLAYAQNRHEIKADLLLPFFKTPHLSYEFMPNEALGIETSLFYRFAEEGNYYIPPTTLFYEAVGTIIPTHQQVLIATVAAKYYFFRPAPASGVFVGGYVRDDVLISPRDYRYSYLFLNLYENGYNYQYQRQLRLAAGLSFGYKYMFGQHFLLEASLGLDIPIEKSRFDDLYGIPGLRLGYRL